MTEKSSIGSLFDRIAGSYDFLNHLLSFNIDRVWRRKAVRRLAPCDRLLDVAIGTGDLAIEIAQKGKAQRIAGLDLSEEMMRLGREKALRRGLTQIAFRQGSALEMPFASDEFDAVTCAFGVRNFADLDQGLREMQRVLRPGGQLLILEFSYPTNRLFRRLYDFYFSHILPKIGRLVSKDKTAYTYLNQSVKGFVWGDVMLQRLHNAGFSSAKSHPLSLGIATIYTATKPC